MNTFAIYTAIVGNYDNILQPKVVDPRFDYILFSNDIKEKKIGIWQIRPIDYYNKDQIKIARWVKTHPEELLPRYDFSIWMDANIQIETDYIYKRSIDLFNKKISISSIVHPERSCIYQEMFAVFFWNYESITTILRWSNVLKKSHFPHNVGLNETGVLFRNHLSPKVMEIDRLWWSFINEYSRRDQLSFNYVLWKLQLCNEPLLPQNQSVYNSKHFNYIYHANNRKKVSAQNKDFSWIQHYCTLHPQKQPKIKKIFFRMMESNKPFVQLKYYEVKYRIIICLKMTIFRLEHFFFKTFQPIKRDSEI